MTEIGLAGDNASRDSAIALADAIGRAHAALLRLTNSPDALSDPLVVSALAVRRRTEPWLDLRPWLNTLLGREPSYGRENPRRYRWDLSQFSLPGSGAYRRPGDLPPLEVRPWEEHEYDGHPSAYGRRMMEPVVIAAQFGFWGQVADDPRTPPDVAEDARRLLDEAVPIAENDLARWFAALDPWRDTLALWLLSAEPHTMERLRDTIFSLGLRGGSIARREGLVKGLRHPFYDRPLVSACAHLAAGLWQCGIYPSVVPGLVNFVASEERQSGGWADSDQAADELTTLAAASLLSRLDPDFDPQPTITWFLRRQEPEGWWRVLDPEVPWLTAAVADWLEGSQRSFSDSFVWPVSPIWSRDRLSELPTLATLEELELALGGVASLARLPIEAAFVDLAGFGTWNTAHGQVRGDDVIALLGKSLDHLPDVYPVRIGGDEFMLLGQPGGRRGLLASTLDQWRRKWPEQLRDVNASGVPPRIIVRSGRAGGLRSLRVELGEQIARAKHDWPTPPPEGALRQLD